MKKIAYLFPGQGAQIVGMGKEWADIYPICRETIEEADDVLRYHLSQVMFQGPQDLLTQTQYSQLALFVHSMAILRALNQQIGDIKPFVCAGLSLGEYTALCASGRLGFRETLLLVKERSRLMNEACERTPGAMAAVLGLSAQEVEQAMQGLEGVWVANYNYPGQTVISGTKEGVERGGQILKEKGAKRVIPLPVHGAFHSGLMQPAQEAFAPWIAKAQMQESPIGFVMNVPGDFVKAVADVKRLLTVQATQSVRWEQGILAMEAQKIALYLEIGCGKTLSGMNQKIGVHAATHSIEKPQDLDALAKMLEGLHSCNC